MTDADLAAIYLATHITVEHDGELRSLREIDLDAGATLHVITAWNPGDERPGVHANDAADRRLHHRLVELGCVPVRTSEPRLPARPPSTRPRAKDIAVPPSE